MYSGTLERTRTRLQRYLCGEDVTVRKAPKCRHVLPPTDRGLGDLLFDLASLQELVELVGYPRLVQPQLYQLLHGSFTKLAISVFQELRAHLGRESPHLSLHRAVPAGGVLDDALGDDLCRST